MADTGSSVSGCRQANGLPPDRFERGQPDTAMMAVPNGPGPVVWRGDTINVATVTLLIRSTPRVPDSPATIARPSEFSRLLVRAAKALDHMGAQTPLAIRKAVASSLRADLGRFTPKVRRQLSKSIAAFAQGFDDALCATAAPCAPAHSASAP